MTCRDLLGLFVAVILLVFSPSAESYNTRNMESIYKDGDVVIGGIFPFHLQVFNTSSCAELRPAVLIWSEAMVYAVEEINKDNGLLKNVALGYDIRDTCENDQEGVAIAADFVYRHTLDFDSRFVAAANSCNVAERSTQRPLVAVIGGVDSRVSVNVANVLQVVDIPQISYGATSAELSSSEFTSFFRTVPLDHFQSQAMADLVTHYGWTCVAVIGVDDWYGRSGVEAFVKAANKTGICVVSHDLFPVHDSEHQIQQMIARLKLMSHVEILILYSLAPQAVLVFEEAVRQELTGKMWIASDGWSDSTVIQQDRFLPIIQGAIGFGFHRFRFQEFEDHVTQLTPLRRQGVWWNEFWEKVLFCAVNSSSGKSCSGQETITTELYRRDFSHGVAAYVRDAVYSVAFALDTFLRQCKTRNECNDVSSVRPENVLSSLKSLSFRGVTGQLDFQKGEAQGAYDIFNLQKTNKNKYNLVQIGFWNATATPERLTIRDELIQWHNGMKPRFSCGELCPAGTYRSVPNQCFWECVSCDEDMISDHTGSTECTRCPDGFISNKDHTNCDEVPIEFIKWDEPWGAALTTVTAVCVLLTLVVLGVVIQKYKTPIIQDTGPGLNILLLVVVTLSHFFNLIHLNKPADFWCQLLPPAFYLIYSSAVVVHLMKIYRIRALVNPVIAHNPAHNTQLVYLTMAAVGLVPIILSVVWVSVDPPVSAKYIVSRLIVYAVCKQYDAFTGLVLRYGCAAYLSALLIATVVVAYSTKHLPRGHKFDEAKHLAFSMTLFLITFATFYPGWALIKGPILTVFACTTNIVAATGIVTCLYGPKLWLIYRLPRCNTRAYVRPAPPEVVSGRPISMHMVTVGRKISSIVVGEPNGSPNHL